jgi:hypothetical protein
MVYTVEEKFFHFVFPPPPWYSHIGSIIRGIMNNNAADEKINVVFRRLSVPISNIEPAKENESTRQANNFPANEVFLCM